MPYPMNYPPYMMPQQTQQDSLLFVPVTSEQEVLNYPVGCGHSVNFKIQNAPYVYTKTMGFSQFDKPVIEKYRLLKEELGENQPLTPAVNNSSVDELKDEISAIWGEIKALKERRYHNNKGDVKNDAK